MADKRVKKMKHNRGYLTGPSAGGFLKGMSSQKHENMSTKNLNNVSGR